MDISKKNIEWLNYKKMNLKILCFSQAVFKKASDFGFDALRVQYFIEPKKTSKNFSDLKIYFWQRSKDITWTLVKNLLKDKIINKIIFRNTPDPFMFGLPIPSKEDVNKYHMEILDKWMNKEEIEKILSDFNVFIAPRKYEGIGMAFLEAMAYGMVVIAPNTSTHNEYIKSGFNGYLYELDNPEPIDFLNLKDISMNALQTVIDGYAEWIKSEGEIVDFINKKSNTAPLNNQEKRILVVGNIFYLSIINVKNIVKKVIKKLLINFK